MGLQSSVPRRRLARSLLSCAKRKLTHKSCNVNRKTQAACLISGLIFIAAMGAYVTKPDGAWRNR